MNRSLNTLNSINNIDNNKMNKNISFDISKTKSIYQYDIE